MLLKVITGIFLVGVCSGQHFVDDAVYTINGKKTLHTVSEKFLSITIDPAILLTGLNLSDTSQILAKHLSPAFIRIAGPSTQFVKYDDYGEDNNDNVIVTPSMWFGINEWLSAANLTPVFAINDRETANGEWNPQSTMPLLDISDKFNLSCYWQLGYDCSNKTEEQYKGDLKRFQHILDAFPDKKDTWKIVASDFRRCVKSSEHVEVTRKILEELEGVVTAVVTESSITMPLIKSKTPIWTVSPKTHHPISFSSAITWAKELGDASKTGYEVVFRQPRFHEIFATTPAFWVSFFHKMLMGRNVLEVKPATSNLQEEVSLYAHCTKHQNEFIRSGAMTVLMINNGTKNHTVLLRFGTVLLKNTEVQSYILTARDEDATDVYLNGVKLTLDHFHGDKVDILPKFRRAKIMNYLSLSLPPKSIGFFILPAAKVPACENEETDDSILEQIKEDQKIPFSKEVSVEVTQRLTPPKKSSTLRDLQNQMQQELATDENYYKQARMKKPKPQNFVIRKHFKEEAPAKKILELELTSGEIRRVLADRAKAKAAKKNIIFTSEELEELMDKATEKFLKNKNTSIRITTKAKREADINMRLLKLKTLGEKRRGLLKLLLQRPKKSPQREKRDINMDLLKLKSVDNKKTLLKRFEVSEDEDQSKKLPDEDVFAEIAESDDLVVTSTTTTTPKPRLKIKQLKPSFKLFKFPTTKTTTTTYKPEERFIPDEPEFNEDFACIHEYGGGFHEDKKKITELWEIDYATEEEGKRHNELPSISNQGFATEGDRTSKMLDEMKDLSLLEDDYDYLESDQVRLKRKTSKIEEDLKNLKRRLVFKKTCDLLGKNNKIPKTFNQRYQSLTDGIKTWKPSDIVTLNKKQVNKRSVDNYVTSVENEIDNFMHEIAKDTRIITPKLDREHGDYQLVFPNQDKIEVAENHGDTEVKLVLHGNDTTPGANRTEVVGSNIQKIAKKQDATLWSKVLRKVVKFFEKLSDKLQNYVLDDLLKS